MKSKYISQYKYNDFEINKSNINLDNLKSNYSLKKISDFIQKGKLLGIVKYNKILQKRLNLSIKNYKEFSEIFTPIEIEIITIINKMNISYKFININENEKSYFHIYFNDNKEEIKNKYRINKEDNVTKIKLIIDYQVKSFEKLFEYCDCIESINFKKFYRNNINNMIKMFYECSSLKEINLSNFNTSNVKDMGYMFYYCSSLKKNKSF